MNHCLKPFDPRAWQNFGERIFSNPFNHNSPADWARPGRPFQMRGPMQDVGAGPLWAVVHKEWDMVERRHNVLAIELSTFDSVRWLEEIHHLFKRGNYLLIMRFISCLYNSGAQEVSSKNEKSAQTAWRGVPINAGPNAAASVTSA